MIIFRKYFIKDQKKKVIINEQKNYFDHYNSSCNRAIGSWYYSIINEITKFNRLTYSAFGGNSFLFINENPFITASRLEISLYHLVRFLN